MRAYFRSMAGGRVVKPKRGGGRPRSKQAADVVDDESPLRAPATVEPPKKSVRVNYTFTGSRAERACDQRREYRRRDPLLEASGRGALRVARRAARRAVRTTRPTRPTRSTRRSRRRGANSRKISRGTRTSRSPTTTRMISTTIS